MSQYNFTKSVTKPPAFDDYLRKRVDSAVYDGVAISGDSVILLTKSELTPAQLSQITQWINDYVDPEIFLQYNHTESSPAYSDFSNSTSLFPLQTLIFVNRNQDNQVLDACKTIITYSTEDVSQFANVESASITFEIYDITRNWQISTQTIDITSDILASWKSQGTGSAESYKSAMFTGLYNKVPDYDCIWQFKASVSNPNFKVRMNGLQYIFYDVL
jgi:hypothetical protein